MEGNNILTNKTQIRNHIINFNNDIYFQRLQTLYYSKSFAEILSVSRRETSHSSFLAWILNSGESHSLGTLPLQKLLEIISIRYNYNGEDLNTKLFNLILTEKYTITSISIETEKTIANVGRIDIYIKTSLLTEKNESITINIIIENKVESKENNNQTNRYYNHFNRTNSHESNIFVYLTPKTTFELNQSNETESINNNFIQINYQILVDYLFEPILNQNIAERTKFIIKEYLLSLSQPALAEKGVINKQKQGYIMALGKDEKELLSNFWRKNEKLIISALYAISIDETQDELVRETTGKALSALSSSDRDYSTINLFINNIQYKTSFKKSDIGYYTIQLLEENELINNEIFNFLREDRSCNFQLIKRKEEIITETEQKKYRVNGKAELIFNGEHYYIARNWGKVNGIDNTEKFIEKITSRFPNITYTRNS
ncbi:MAG: PD-(D/E)XK nuclease family protein [Breznakibacter sp.]|nr:PD-(D/E)XK nuclease family protein [Breznakibacter sp.]